MAYSNNITPGSPPLLWSNVQEAFTKINENFDILVTTIGDGSGLVPLAFESLDADISPSTNNLYKIGSDTHKWKSIYTSEYAATDADAYNGVWLGLAHIKGKGYTVDLPLGSTVSGTLIKDPTRVFFKEVQVDNNFSIVAIEGSNSFGINSGTAITLDVDSASEAITINNAGVVAVTGSTGISVSSATGNVTFTNTGVTSLTNTTALPSGRTRGTGINVSAATGGISLTNTGVLSIEAGSAALIVSTDAATGIVTITNAAPAGNAFRYVSVNGLGTPIEANNVNGQINFVSGQGITLSQNTGTDTVTFAVNPVFDLRGSVFGDDSSKIVDAVENKIYSTFFGDLTGNTTGDHTGNVYGSIMGATGVFTTQVNVGSASQGSFYTSTNDVYVGNLNAGSKLGLTVREGILQKIVLDIDSTAKTITLDNTYTVTGFKGAVTGNIFTNLIDSADSSAITVTPKTIFNSDVDIENELRVRGSLMISVTQLKSIAAASADYAAFKTAIAALAA